MGFNRELVVFDGCFARPAPGAAMFPANSFIYDRIRYKGSIRDYNIGALTIRLGFWRQGPGEFSDSFIIPELQRAAAAGAIPMLEQQR